MCLAVPMRLVELTPAGAAGVRVGVVEVGGLQRKVRLDLLDDVRVGDQLLVHAGFAIQVIDPAEAERLVSMLEELIAGEPGDGGP